MQEELPQDLAALGLARNRSRHLLLLPLAYVAAASRRRDVALLDHLIESSAQAAKIDSAGLELARTWVRQPPTPRQFEVALEHLRVECQSTTGDLTVRDLIESVFWACSAAQLDRERVGRRYAPVSAGAREAIRDLEGALGIDVGELWSDVLEELGEELPPGDSVLPPHVHAAPEARHPRNGGAPDSAPGSASRPGG